MWNIPVCVPYPIAQNTLQSAKGQKSVTFILRLYGKKGEKKKRKTLREGTFLPPKFYESAIPSGVHKVS